MVGKIIESGILVGQDAKRGAILYEQVCASYSSACAASICSNLVSKVQSCEQGGCKTTEIRLNNH